LLELGALLVVFALRSSLATALRNAHHFDTIVLAGYQVLFTEEATIRAVQLRNPSKGVSVTPKRRSYVDLVGWIPVQHLAIAHEAYIKYVPRIGREPPPMLADFAAEIAAGHVVVIEVAQLVEGYLISWPKIDVYFIDNIAVNPAHQGLGLGRQLMEYAVREAKRHNLSAIQLYTNATMTENLAIYAHMGFVETHRVMETQFHIETGFPRVYMWRSLA
jgi:ribosomal protein S18 acetylase RimI-like enzyme